MIEPGPNRQTANREPDANRDPQTRTHPEPEPGPPRTRTRPPNRPTPHPEPVANPEPGLPRTRTGPDQQQAPSSSRSPAWPGPVQLGQGWGLAGLRQGGLGWGQAGVGQAGQGQAGLGWAAPGWARLCNSRIGYAEPGRLWGRTRREPRTGGTPNPNRNPRTGPAWGPELGCSSAARVRSASVSRTHSGWLLLSSRAIT